MTKRETATAENENKLRHVGFDCVEHAFLEVFVGANAPELTSLGLVGHCHRVHEVRNAS